ncbi:amidase [Streptomyces sparsogenes]|uniref:Indoleacetamide hydrolase n=1 Tax=Streptomyces sparsogenes DSM 40356 TaxID=1331668 RepID=A0A1R1SCX3_9ACTN|nr:amidase [Streptomyces sparsogenes]OMI36261.1 indoleacetamide hydrolase [Streptomyces sparsogenes DSM 40356]
MTADPGAERKEAPWWARTAREQAAAVREGRVTAAEVAESHLERIAEVNPVVNAVTQLLADQAREAAAGLDRRRERGEDLPPLAGVCFTVKESIAVRGVPTTHGATRFKDAVAAADAPPVARLRAAGAIPVGHSNMPTLTLAGMHSRSQLFGDTLNPWDPGRTPGGSSGGDGAAVACGMAGLGLGNDAGGSVRIPAAFCGTAALKPTYGRFPADHRIGPEDPPLGAQLCVVDGPLARTVADLWPAFEALAGADPADPRAVPVPPRGAPVARPVRVAVVADPGGSGVHPTVRRAVERAADALADAGYAVEEVADVPRLGEALEVYDSLLMTEFSLSWPAVRTLLGTEGRRYIEMHLPKTRMVDLPGYIGLTGVLLNLRRAWAEFLDRYPLVLGPVFTEPPVEPGVESRDKAGNARVRAAMRLCSATSLVGVPAVAVPTGLADGLPTGVQLIGRAYREDLCLDAAAAVEERLGVLTPITPVMPVTPTVPATPTAPGGTPGRT